MIRQRDIDPAAPIIVVSIGNTHTRVAAWANDSVLPAVTCPTGDPKAFEEAVNAHLEALGGKVTPPVVIGSVVPEALARIKEYLHHRFERNPLVVGENLPLPMDVGVDDAKAIGVDRVCAAAAAYERLQTCCVVVDFGTAVTVDLVDEDGVLRGGAILPGVELQLQSLNERTAQLPKVEAAVPQSPYGRNTTEAIQNGVCRGLAGAVRALVEGYATSLNRWPQVVATGGDLALLLEQCDFLDTPVQDLTLRGIGLAYTKFLGEKGV